VALPAFGSACTYSVASETATTPIRFDVPTGVVAGDIILAFIYIESTADVTPPDVNWTQVAPTPTVTSPATFVTRAFWKRATGTESTSNTYAFTYSGSPGDPWRDGVAVRISRCIPTGTLIDAVTSATQNTDNKLDPATSITTTGPDRLILWGGGAVCRFRER
jgi:hypothetical protein